MTETETLHSRSKRAYNPGVEARIAVLEQIAEDTKGILTEIKQDTRELRRDQRTDFRVLFAALVTATLGLAGLIAHGFHWI